MRSRTRPLRLLLAALALASCAAAPAPEPRAQRSANLSHITGTSRTIQMFLKNRYLQLLPDGTVNGTTDYNSVYSEYSFLFFCLSSWNCISVLWSRSRYNYGYTYQIKFVFFLFFFLCFLELPGKNLTSSMRNTKSNVVRPQYIVRFTCLSICSELHKYYNKPHNLKPDNKICFQASFCTELGFLQLHYTISQHL